MIDRGIIEQFSPITDEEKLCLEENNAKAEWETLKSTVFAYEKYVNDERPIFICKHRRFAHTPPHKHNYIEMVYVCQGKMTQIINGERIDLCQGQLLFLSSGAEHEILPSGEDDIAINFLLSKTFVQSESFISPIYDNVVSNFIVSTLFNSEENGFLVFDTDGCRSVENIIENIILSMWDEKLGNNNFVLQQTFALLFLELGYRQKNDPSKDNNDVDRMHTIYKYIEKCYQTATLAEIAKNMYLSSGYLSRYIKTKTGLSFSTLLHQKRLNNAEQLVRCTNKSISDIIQECGYKTASHFHKSFREKFGCSPKQYRKRYLK